MQGDAIVVPESIVDPLTNTVYVRGRMLGQGGFAQVYQVQTKLPSSGNGPVAPSNVEHLAIKVMSKATIAKAKAKAKLMSEIRIHKSLGHPNVVGFHRCFDDDANFYIVLELCENQTLLELVKRRKCITELEAKYYLLQVLAAVKYLHGRRVIHRDLKLGNLFLNHKLEVKIGDYGLATVVEHEGERKRTICGTPNYIAPEILDETVGHSYEVDVWSMGVILYTLLVGRPPFQTKELKLTYKKIRENDYSFPPECAISTEAVSLIRHLLHPEPAKRATLDDVYRSPFLTSGFVPNDLPMSSLSTEPLLLPSFGVPRHEVRRLVSETATVSPSTALAASLATLTLEKDRTDARSAGFIKSPASTADQQRGKENASRQKQINSCTPATSSTIAPDILAPRTVPDPITIFPTTTQAPVTKADVPEIHTMLAGVTRHLSSSDALSSPMSTGGSKPPTTTQLSPTSSGITADGSLLLLMARRLHKLLDSTTSVPGASSAITPASTTGSGLVHFWVGKWVDYANKYGLGYQLTTGAFGVFFNDRSNMILTPNHDTIEYCDSSRANALVHTHAVDKIPSSLTKKWTLLQHFKEYMQGNLTKEPVQTGETLSAIRHVRVTKWIRTKRAILFRLSHGVVQINFFDHSKLMLASDGEVLFINECRVASLYNLDALEATMAHAHNKSTVEIELFRRLRSAHDLLFSVVQPASGTNTSGASGYTSPAALSSPAMFNAPVPPVGGAPR